MKPLPGKDTPRETIFFFPFFVQTAVKWAKEASLNARSQGEWLWEKEYKSKDSER